MPRNVLALVPAYNPEPQALHKTIQSLIDQTVEIDIAVIDDGSQQPLAPLVEQFPRARAIRLEPNGGITAALRLGVEAGLAEGYRYFCRLDVGDVSYPDRVEAQLAHMEAHPDIAILGGLSRVVDMEGNLLFVHGVPGREAARRYLFANAPFKHSTFFMRSAAVRKLGNYDLTFNGAEDYEFLMRSRTTIDCLAKVLIDYDDDPNGISTQKRRQQLTKRLMAQLAHRAPLTLLWYLGIARSLATLIVPQSLAKQISLALWRRPPPSGAS